MIEIATNEARKLGKPCGQENRVDKRMSGFWYNI